MPKTMLLNYFSNSNTDSYFYHIKIKLYIVKKNEHGLWVCISTWRLSQCKCKNHENIIKLLGHSGFLMSIFKEIIIPIFYGLRFK